MGTPIFDDLWVSILSRRTAAQKTAYLGASGMYGLDTSSWQRIVAWPAVAASGRSFAYVKASEGNGRSYPTLDAQYQGAMGAGVITGLYHYALPESEPGGASPEENADAFAQQINRLGATRGHLPPALDLEVGDGDMSEWAQRFITRLRQQIGYNRICVYSSASFFSDYIGEHWMDDDVVLWVAHFGAAPGHPKYLTKRVAIHQYSQTGAVPGVDADVDLNYALWPLSQIIDGSDELTPDQNRMLEDIHDMLPVIEWIFGQMAGSGPDGKPPQFPNVPGWLTWDGGSGEHLSLLDYLRRNNVAVQQLSETVQAAVSAGGSPIGVDVKTLADEIVAEFFAKLSSPGVSGV